MVCVLVELVGFGWVVLFVCYLIGAVGCVVWGCWLVLLLGYWFFVFIYFYYYARLLGWIVLGVGFV